MDGDWIEVENELLSEFFEELRDALLRLINNNCDSLEGLANECYTILTDAPEPLRPPKNLLSRYIPPTRTIQSKARSTIRRPRNRQRE